MDNQPINQALQSSQGTVNTIGTDPMAIQQAAAQLTQQRLKRQKLQMSDPSTPDNSVIQQATATQQSSNQQDTRAPGAVTGNHDWDGLCEAYVEQQTTGKTGLYPTAIAAFNDMAAQGKSVDQPKPGDLIYFNADASNQGAGHAAIYLGDGKMRSATYNGVREDSVADWTKQTGQSIAGYVNPK